MSDELRKKLHGYVDLIADGLDSLELVRQLVPNTSKSSGGEALDSTTKPSPKVTDDRPGVCGDGDGPDRSDGRDGVVVPDGLEGSRPKGKTTDCRSADY